MKSSEWCGSMRECVLILEFKDEKSIEFEMELKHLIEFVVYVCVCVYLAEHCEEQCLSLCICMLKLLSG